MAFFRRLPLKPPQLAPLLDPLTPEEVKKGKSYPPNARLWTEESFQALQRFLRDLFLTQEGGLPAGNATTPPSTVKAGVPSSVGLPEVGWSPGSHVHAVLTAAPGAITLGTAAAEGSSQALARSDHVHDTILLQSQIEDDAFLAWIM
jgi:hypothetical protein